MNEAVSTFAMNIKSKAKNTSVHMNKLLPAKTHRRAATGNTESREAPRTAGGPWSLGRRPAMPSGTRPGAYEGVPPDLYLVRKVMDCFD